MATTEQSRRRLHRELTDVMGEERATMLVDHFPPFDWADLATKRDLADLEQRLDATFEARFGAIDGRFGAIDARFAAIDGRFAAIDVRFDNIDAALRRADEKFATREDLLRGLGELRAEMHRDLRTSTLTLFFGNAAVAGLVVTLTKLVA